MGKTGIAWTDATWNPVTGCSKVSPGCAHCYAQALSKRFGRSFEVTLHPERLDEPLHWRKPRRVFVCSMADLFHPDVPDEFLLRVFDTIRSAALDIYGAHTFQILTKRPERMRDFGRRLRFDGSGNGGKGRMWLADDPDARDGYRLFGGAGCSGQHGLWLGTSIENDRFSYRADILRETPVPLWNDSHRFISAEPLLGPLPSLDLTGIDWVIIGGESGPKARPMKPEWALDLIDRAHDAGVAVFVKQASGARPGMQGNLPDWAFALREYPR